MVNYLLKKLLLLVTSLFLVSTLTFFLMHAIPGDPFADEQGVPEEVMRALHAHYHLDLPLVTQYGLYLKNLLQGNLGPSLKYEGRTANDIIADRFPTSCFLGLGALFLALSCGMWIGTTAAMRQGTKRDRFIMLGAVIGISLPSFILATFLQYGLAIKLHLFPIARWGTLEHAVLPTLSLAAFPMAVIAKLTRTSVIEVLQQDYILTAKSKGIQATQILLRHVLRNAILPVITYLGLCLASILTGSFAIERIFGIPGLGHWFISSISNRDYTIIMSLAIFYSGLLMLSIFILDILYCLIDPRIKTWRYRSGRV